MDYGYDPYPGCTRPATGFFSTGGSDNQGGYSNPEMNKLINATEYGSSPQAFFAYEDYAARQLPWLWLPNSATTSRCTRATWPDFAPLNPFSGSHQPGGLVLHQS